jgi:hypothetical protein
VANFGSPDLDLTPDASNGVFSRNSSTKIADVLDGLSNTFFIGERVNGVRHRSSRWILSFSFVPGLVHGTIIPHHGGTGEHIHYETAWAGATRDRDDPTDDHGHMVLFHTAHTPNSLATDDRDITGPHAGAALFLMGDASVQSIAETIDAQVYSALGTRAGREVVGHY